MKKKIKQDSNLMTYLPVIITAVVIFVLSLTFVRVKIQEISSARTQIKESRERLKKLSTKIEKIQQIDLSSIDEKKEITRNTLPTLKNIPLILNTLETLTVQSKLHMLLLKVNPGEISTGSGKALPVVQAADEKNSFKLEITINGSYKDVTKFIKMLNSSNPLVSVERVILTLFDSQDKEDKEDEEQNPSTKMTAQIELLAYYLPELQTIGKPSDPLPKITDGQKSTYDKIKKFESFATLVEMVPTGKSNPFVLVE